MFDSSSPTRGEVFSNFYIKNGGSGNRTRVFSGLEINVYMCSLLFVFRSSLGQQTNPTFAIPFKHSPMTPWEQMLLSYPAWVSL